jgi:hypothetical protein
MVAAMSISGPISWFVVMSGQPVLDVVFWRCLFGAVALLAVCGARGLLSGTRRCGNSERQTLGVAKGSVMPTPAFDTRLRCGGRIHARA